VPEAATIAYINKLLKIDREIRENIITKRHLEKFLTYTSIKDLQNVIRPKSNEKSVLKNKIDNAIETCAKIKDFQEKIEHLTTDINKFIAAITTEQKRLTDPKSRIEHIRQTLVKEGKVKTTAADEEVKEILKKDPKKKKELETFEKATNFINELNHAIFKNEYLKENAKNKSKEVEKEMPKKSIAELEAFITDAQNKINIIDKEIENYITKTANKLPSETLDILYSIYNTNKNEALKEFRAAREKEEEKQKPRPIITPALDNKRKDEQDIRQSQRIEQNPRKRQRVH
jgi:hypothetical protein